MYVGITFLELFSGEGGQDYPELKRHILFDSKILLKNLSYK